MSIELNSEKHRLYSFALNEQHGIPISFVIKNKQPDGQVTFTSVFKLKERQDTLIEYLKVVPTELENDALFIWYNGHQRDSDILETINDTFHSLYQTKKNRFVDIETLIFDYSTWEKAYRDKLEEDRIVWENLKMYTEQLLEQKPLTILNEAIIHREISMDISFSGTGTGINLSGQSLTFSPKDILDTSVVSLNVPMIVYRKKPILIASEEYDEHGYRKEVVIPLIDRYITEASPETVTEENIYKVIDLPKLLYKITVHRTDLNLNRGIYLLVNTSDSLDGDAKGVQTDGLNNIDIDAIDTRKYLLVKIDLDSLKLNVTLSVANEMAILDRITKAIPSLILSNVKKEIKIKGSFDVYAGLNGPMDLPFYPDILAQLMLREPMLRYYIYLDETKTPLALSDRFLVKYEGELSSTFKQRFDTSLNVKYIEVNVSDAPNRGYFDIFKMIISHLMSFYLNNFQPYFDVYNNIYPLVIQNKYDNVNSDDDGGVSTHGMKSEALNRQAPDIFTKEYSRNCQSRHGVDLIKREDVQSVLAVGIPVMPFPKDNPKVFAVCNDPEFRYPGVKVNIDTSNNIKFPYIPCCFKTSQMAREDNSTYNKYIHGTVVVKQGDEPMTTNYIYKKFSILGPYEIGAITVDLDKFLKNVMTTASLPVVPGDFYRMGIFESTSSVIHCILEAMGNLEYLSLPWPQREAFVVRLRKSLVNLNLEVLRQAFPVESTDTLKEMILNLDLNLSPTSFSKLLELKFGVGMYSLSLNQVSSSTFKLTENKHLNFSVFPLSLDRPVVVIFEHDASLSEGHCELIAHFNSNKTAAIKLFGQSMNTALYKAYIESYAVLTWTPKIENKLTSLSGYLNVYSTCNWVLSLKDTVITGMHLDDHGKMRGLNFQFLGKDMTIFFLPCQPENYIRTDKIFKSTTRDVISLVGSDFTGKSDDGLWYPMSQRNDSIFFPVIFNEDLILLSIPKVESYYVPNDPDKVKNNGLDNLRSLRKQANYVIQILRYLYDIHRVSFKGTLIDPLPQFFGYISHIPNQTYNFDSLTKSLPNFTNLPDALAWLSTFETGFIKSSRIIVYNEKFYNRLITYLTTYQHDTEGLYPDIPRILDIILDETDFIKQKNTKIFLTEKNMNTWLRSQNFKLSDNLVVTSMTLDLARYIDPFVYRNSQGNYFLIQNISGHLNEALLVSKTWRDSKINIGRNTGTVGDSTIKGLLNEPHIIVGVSRSKELTLVTDNSRGDYNALWILAYNPDNPNGLYASLMSLA